MTIQEDIVSSLEEKIKQVVDVAKDLKINNERLQQQVNELSELLRVKNQEIGVLESKYQSLRIVKTLVSSSEDVKDLKIQVNRMVREIDKCIALLNK